MSEMGDESGIEEEDEDADKDKKDGSTEGNSDNPPKKKKRRVLFSRLKLMNLKEDSGNSDTFQLQRENTWLVL